MIRIPAKLYIAIMLFAGVVTFFYGVGTGDASTIFGSFLFIGIGGGVYLLFAKRDSVLSISPAGDGTQKVPTSSENENLISATPSHGDEKPRVLPYYDACFALAFSLSRSIPLSEWAQKLPSGYGLRESMSISKTRQLVDNGLLALTRESRPRLSDASQFARGGYRPEVAAGVAECLQRLLAEISLLTLARELITEDYDGWLDENLLEDDLEPGKHPIGDIEDIVSTYLKAWLPNLNPFVLLELANFLTDQGHLNEANEALSAVETFPEYSKNKKSDPNEGSAQAIALESLPPDLVGSIKAISLTDVCYSREARQRLLPAEIFRIRTKLGGSLRANEDHRNIQLPGAPEAVPVLAKREFVSAQYPSLTEMLESAMPGRWVVVKRRERTNVFPSPRPGYEVQCPEGFRFRKEYSEGYEHRHGAHSRHFEDAETVKRLAGTIGKAVEQCPPECECRTRNIDRMFQS